MKKKLSAKRAAAKSRAEVPPRQGRLLSLEFLQGRADERENLLALERLLTRAEGFTLAFGRVNMSAQRAALVQEIRRLEPQGFVIVEVDLREPVRDLLNELAQRLENVYGFKAQDETRELAVAEAGPRFAVFVYGLENSISSSAIYHPLLAVMNYKRENFREHVPGPLVLWVPEYVLQAVMEGAPDFWAWRSGVFEFAAPQAELEKMRGQFDSERGSVALARLSVEEKRNRIQLFSNLLAEYESHDHADTPEIMVIRADLLNRLGLLHKHSGVLDKALQHYEKSLSLRHKIGDRAGEGTTLNNISQVFKARGDYGKALEYLEKSLVIRREIGDRAGEGTTLNNLATTAYAGGDYGKALEYLEKSLAIQREIGDRAGEGTTLNNISQIYDARGDYGKALDYLEKSLAITREIGDRAGEGATLNNLSQIYGARGDYGKALEYLEKSLAIRREIGDRAGEGTTLNNLSGIYRAGGDYGKALEYLEKSLAITREIGDRAGEGTTSHNIAHIHWQNQSLQAAVENFLHALQIAREINYAELIFAASRDLGSLLCQAGQKQQGLPLLQQALAVGRQIGHPGLPQVEELLRKHCQ